MERLLPKPSTPLNRHTNRMRLERLPDDPPIPLEETIQNLQNLPTLCRFSNVGRLESRSD